MLTNSVNLCIIWGGGWLSIHLACLLDGGMKQNELSMSSLTLVFISICLGDQIVGATVYFDNMSSEDIQKVLATVGHHTVGLKLQRKGDRSPLPGATFSHDVFSVKSPDVVLVSKVISFSFITGALILQWTLVYTYREVQAFLQPIDGTVPLSHLNTGFVKGIFHQGYSHTNCVQQRSLQVISGYAGSHK